MSNYHMPAFSLTWIVPLPESADEWRWEIHNEKGYRVAAGCAYLTLLSGGIGYRVVQSWGRGDLGPYLLHGSIARVRQSFARKVGANYVTITRKH